MFLTESILDNYLDRGEKLAKEIKSDKSRNVRIQKKGKRRKTIPFLSEEIDNAINAHHTNIM